MLNENIFNDSGLESTSHLRVIKLSERNSFCFFYLGTNEATLNYLSQVFESGFSAEDFKEAEKVIISADFADETPDLIFIDLPFEEDQIKSFNEFLRLTNYNSLPVVYNEKHLPKGNLFIYTKLVDDVFDIFNARIDYTTKVSFLKEAKAYQISYEQAYQLSYEQAKAEEKACKDNPLNCFFKRTFDIVVSSILIIFLAPLFLLIALIIKLESKGPVFYNAKRAGRGFRIFKFYKFRTMKVNADKMVEALAELNQYNVDGNGPKFFKISNDPRITKVGKLLRNTSLDELPQLFNVLKGDMSLVGNRPLPLYEAATLTTNEFVERFMAPSGITGLWQIKKRGQADMSVEERINLDIAYARKSNLLYDLWIMVRTPAVLFQKSNV